jgi:hypothetical protein
MQFARSPFPKPDPMIRRPAAQVPPVNACRQRLAIPGENRPFPSTIWPIIPNVPNRGRGDREASADGRAGCVAMCNAYTCSDVLDPDFRTPSGRRRRTRSNGSDRKQTAVIPPLATVMTSPSLRCSSRVLISQKQCCNNKRCYPCKVDQAGSYLFPSPDGVKYFVCAERDRRKESPPL